MSIFSDIKERISLKDIAIGYGINLNRNDMANCVFHNEKTPSMKIFDKGFCCYGCGEKGDTIAFVAKLFDLSLYESVLKINADFSLGIDTNQKLNSSEIVKSKSQVNEKNIVKQEFDTAFKILVKYLHILRDWKEEYAPKANSFDTILDMRFVECLQEFERVNFVSSQFICSKGYEGDKETLRDYGEYINKVANRISQIEIENKGMKNSVIGMLKQNNEKVALSIPNIDTTEKEYSL